MGFKSDREFLRNISIGAVGTRKVASLLNAGGFRVIELERYCTCNKIWGFLPELSERAGGKLDSIAESGGDVRIRLEAAASLARLGSDAGWNQLAAVARDATALAEHRMEVALILGELPCERSANLLEELARDKANPSELRAAAVWALAAMPWPQSASPLTYVNEDGELTAVHAIVASSRLITDENVEAVLAGIDDDQRRSAGIVRAVLRSDCNPVAAAVNLLKAATGNRRSWLLYLLASEGRAKCADYLRQSAPELLSQLEFFWTHQTENWTNRLDVADQIDFLAQQNIR